MTVVVPDFDEATLEEVAGRLDLRAPNRDAIQTLALRMLRHYDDSQEPFEGVLDAATGVGKTYIIAGAIDYFARMGLRNFAVITPGQTILAKTVAQFTPGGSKSLLAGMSVTPVVITSENFRSAAMRAAMDDESRVKLFVFTVQSLIKPSTKAGRRTHSFQEGLGQAFYEHLDGLHDLIVFADEHHCYYGDGFSAAVRDLTPLALVGLTGTPHPKTPADRIIFRYPLTAAIADRLVKTPVIVGRRDDLADEHTQLLDGVRLLEAKQGSLDRYCERESIVPVNAVMLVNCKDIAHAEEVGALLTSPQFQGGAYADAVLVVHSNQPDAALAALDGVEDPDSPVRIIVQVGMLKEGWDVRTVYVIASLRASVSQILTEQTMGRGLRLPFGRYTEWDMLDELEILAHEQYEKVLARTKLLHERFIDHRTVIVTRTDMHGEPVVSIEERPVGVAVIGSGGSAGETWGADGLAEPPTPAVRIARQAEREAEIAAPPLIHPRADAPQILVPHVETRIEPARFSLAQIIERAPYRELGRRLAAGHDATLRRTRIGARIVPGPDGDRSTQLAPANVVDAIESQAPGLPLDQARARIVTTVRANPVVPGRPGEGKQVDDLLDAVAAGAGAAAAEVFGRYADRVARELIGLIVRDQRKLKLSAESHEVIETRPLDLRPRPGRRDVSTDHLAKFSRAVAYGGWRKNPYPLATFDSGTERDMARLLDGAEQIALWLRLVLGDLPIPRDGGGEYHPDFLAIDSGDIRWVIEVKADREMERDDVQAKRADALRWVNVVSGAAQDAGRWRYALVAESDLLAAKGSWSALVAALAM